jgi:hypothetical protein
MMPLLFAHIGHWTGLMAFAVPGLLTVMWAAWTGFRDRRRDRFAEYWTLSRRDGRWRLVAVQPDGKAAHRSPWSGGMADQELEWLRDSVEERAAEVRRG